MISIRPSQMDAFATYRTHEFESQLANHLIRVCPESVYRFSEPQLIAQIRVGIDRARGYRILHASQVASFVQLLFEEGFEFDEQPPDPTVRSVLLDHDRDEFEKVDYLWAIVDGITPDELAMDADSDEAQDDFESEPDDHDEPDVEEDDRDWVDDSVELFDDDEIDPEIPVPARHAVAVSLSNSPIAVS